MHRWTAKLLLLVMLVPAVAPLALAGTAPPGMHCMRRPLRETAPAALPAMHCHHGMVQAPPPASSEASLRALDCCCQNHDCCRSLKTSEWARPASILFSFISLLIEPSPTAPVANQASADFIAPGSARAPPRS